MAIEEPLYQVQIAGHAATGADRQLTGQMGAKNMSEFGARFLNLFPLACNSPRLRPRSGLPANRRLVWKREGVPGYRCVIRRRGQGLSPVSRRCSITPAQQYGRPCDSAASGGSMSLWPYHKVRAPGLTVRSTIRETHDRLVREIAVNWPRFLSVAPTAPVAPEACCHVCPKPRRWRSPANESGECWLPQGGKL